MNRKIFIMAALTGASFSGALFANSGFKVSQSTGLELDAPTSGLSAGSSARKAPAPAPQEKRPTEITASKETTFDEKARVAVFAGDVTVVDSQFNLTCEKLTAYLKKGSSKEKGANEKGAAENGAANKAASDDKSDDKNDEPDMGGGLERVVAEGNVVIVQEKPSSNGEVTRYVGKAKKAEYNAATGDVTLSGWPQLQQGINNQVSTEEGTIMILNKSGRLRTIGGSKTLIQDSSDKTLLKAGKSDSSRSAANP